MIHRWRCRDRFLEIDKRALVMGIVNVTPDSFSDGGRLDSSSKAIDYALRLLDEGADLLDVGGESSRPGAAPVPLDEELRRVVPIVEGICRRASAPVSVDTVKAEVARQSLDAGACIINDVSALNGDPAMAETVRAYGAGVILMHMRGNPQTMQNNPTYDDVVADIGAFLEERMTFAENCGIARDAIALDPGIGFGKTLEHTLEQLRRLAEYQRFGRPICLGVSRKGFIGQILERPRDQRTIGSVVVACKAVSEGAAQIVRVHDVAAHRDAVLMLEALMTR